jgi:hypothetical protein
MPFALGLATHPGKDQRLGEHSSVGGYLSIDHIPAGHHTEMAYDWIV